MSKKDTKISSKVLHVLPGLFVCIAIALVSKFLGQYLPTLGAATISIFLGIIIGNTIGKHPALNKGTKFSEGTLLSISVVLLGATLSITTLFELGVNGILFILLQMIFTVTGAVIIGKRMKFTMDFTLLMASGNGVCGSSAIASTAPVIHAHSRDKGIAITMVNVTGTVLMILLPLLTLGLYQNELVRSSAMLGGILQSVGQVVAAGSMVSEEVKELATIFKIVRIIFLVGVVMILASIKTKSIKEGVHDIEEEVHSHNHQSRIKMPWYIKGFFLTCALYSLKIIPNNWGAKIKEIDNFIEIVALAGIGMRVYIADLIKQGLKVSVYCLFIALVQVVAAILLIAILF
ncbi:putative membrane protein YeiH [Lachnospiraceae bacterium KM106-2]|nr:putative membrane protein YeiH [Lachnospiraceae bacterium KM106-2]